MTGYAVVITDRDGFLAKVVTRNGQPLTKEYAGELVVAMNTGDDVIIDGLFIDSGFAMVVESPIVDNYVAEQPASDWNVYG